MKCLDKEEENATLTSSNSKPANQARPRAIPACGHFIIEQQHHRAPILKLVILMAQLEALRKA